MSDLKGGMSSRQRTSGLFLQIGGMRLKMEPPPPLPRSGHQPRFSHHFQHPETSPSALLPTHSHACLHLTTSFLQQRNFFSTPAIKSVLGAYNYPSIRPYYNTNTSDKLGPECHPPHPMVPLSFSAHFPTTQWFQQRLCNSWPPPLDKPWSGGFLVTTGTEDSELGHYHEKLSATHWPHQSLIRIPNCMLLTLAKHVGTRGSFSGVMGITSLFPGVMGITSLFPGVMGIRGLFKGVMGITRLFPGVMGRTSLFPEVMG